MTDETNDVLKEISSLLRRRVEQHELEQLLAKLAKPALVELSRGLHGFRGWSRKFQIRVIRGFSYPETGCA